MLRYGFEIYQQLIKMFVRTNKRFPNKKENKFLQNQALRVREGLFDRGVNMEELSAEDAIKVFSQPPRKRKRPTAEIYKPLEFGKKSKPKEGEAEVIDFPVTPKPPEGEPFKDGGKVKKSKTDKIIDFLGGKDVVAAELGLLGIEQLYNLLGIPLGFAGGGAVGSPPVYQTNDPKEAAKVVIDAMMGGSGIETLPIYSGDNLNINAGVGVGAFKPFDYGINFQYGDFGGGAQVTDGTRSMGIGYNPDPLTRFGVDYSQNMERGPMFGLQYERRFAQGGVASGPPPKRGPNPQGLETLFQTR